MAYPAHSEEELRQALDAAEKYGGATAAASALGVNRSTFQARLDAARARLGVQFNPDEAWTFEREKRIEVFTGTVVVSSDHHYWPGEPSLAHRALVQVIKQVKPRVKVMNGDIFDGATIGRHDPFGWSVRPTVMQELEACQERVGEIEQALPKGCERYFNVGNHDVRFERNLAGKNPGYAGVKGMRLADHFPGWEFQWSLLVNPDAHPPTMIKHRFANGGIHGGHNAVMKSGVNTVSGHTHLLSINSWGDYRGRRYGVQTGTCADLEGPAMEYHENNPSPACPGFAVLTFDEGQLVHPELCEVKGGKAWFRGRIVAE